MTELNHDYDKIRKELLELADKVQNGELANDKSNRELRGALESLRKLYDAMYEDAKQSKVLISSVDREQAIQLEKNSNIFYQLGQLERRIEELEEGQDKASQKNLDMIEKVFMLFIGGFVTYLFSLMN